MRDFNKIFIIGLSRTGTTSLSNALNLAGISCRHFPNIEKNIISGNYELEILKSYRALSDTPIVPIYKQLDKAYPNSLFIFTTRELSSWLNSCESYFYQKDGLEKNTKFETLNNFHRLYTYGCHGFNREKFTQVYNDHRKDVANYFKDRKDDLLTMNIFEGDNWDKLCQFLQIEQPKSTFPFANSSKFFSEKIFNRLKNISIATVTDKNYLPITDFMIYNFLQKNPWFIGDINVIINGEDQQEIESLKKYPNVKIISASHLITQKIKSLVSNIPQLKKIASRFLTLEAFNLKGYDKVLFLDSDILITADIRELFDFNGDLHCAPDSCYFNDTFRDYKTHRHVDKMFINSYGRQIKDSFNSGVMVIPKRLINQKVYKGLIELLDVSTWEGIEVPKLADQIVLNRYFQNNNSIISSKYNFVIFLEKKIYEKERISFMDAKIIHFAGTLKPWDSILNRDLDFRYWKYLELWRTEYKIFCKTLDSKETTLYDMTLRDGLYPALDLEELDFYVKRKIQKSVLQNIKGHELKRRRQERNLSAKKLAHKLQINEDILRDYENNDIIIPFRLMEKIIIIFNNHPIDHQPNSPNTRNRFLSKLKYIGKKIAISLLLFLPLFKSEKVYAQTSGIGIDPTKILDNGVITNNYKTHKNRSKPSAGIDIDAPGLEEGSKARVKSATDGTVTAVNPKSGFIQITDNKGNKHEYLHLDFTESHAMPGETVVAGQRIGALGNTGTNKDHVHYQVKDSNGNHLNPETIDYLETNNAS